MGDNWVPVGTPSTAQRGANGDCFGWAYHGPARRDQKPQSLANEFCQPLRTTDWNQAGPCHQFDPSQPVRMSQPQEMRRDHENICAVLDGAREPAASILLTYKARRYTQ